MIAAALGEALAFIRRYPRLIATLLAALALIVVAALIYRQIYTSGYEAAQSAIAEQDKGAVDAADKASARRRACIDSGRMWSVATGQCR
ncbi:MAG: hypothetical protein KF735_02155 [Chelatococcus sp.]|uniref:hypothetical protein n=1 Tax=unclassified Chelatococcus TaxID=2638111 RepID=UPI001BCEE533|nr:MULTISPECIES: hypothetical protein [unclassified Chelatococcus]CAH1670847.1 hypothetical protein CHELA41_23451 [Hyphomicrobiales bacterium]MBS7738388.1 hypothetical protein [Chelatococcus sp. HY11]MBX3536415.1 hypothetical protein [Chelatococcus sp.]MBX3542792.1 hypothetical protein [Chelatococcus sp.]MCO5077082.1 hypothetical protein [Chelatococcus sp.]